MYPGSSSDVNGLSMWNTTTAWYDANYNYMIYVNYSNMTG